MTETITDNLDTDIFVDSPEESQNFRKPWEQAL